MTESTPTVPIQDLADMDLDSTPGDKTDKTLPGTALDDWLLKLAQLCASEEDLCEQGLCSTAGPNTTMPKKSTSTLCSLLSTPSNTPQESKQDSDLSQAAAGTLENADVYRRLTMTLRSDARGDRKPGGGSH